MKTFASSLGTMSKLIEISLPFLRLNLVIWIIMKFTISCKGQCMWLRLLTPFCQSAYPR